MSRFPLQKARAAICCVAALLALAACDARDHGAVGGGMASVAPKVLFQAKQGGPWWPNGLYVTPGDHFLCASFSGDPGQSAVYLYDLASRSLSAGVDSDRRWIPLADAPEAGVMLAALKGEDLCRGVLRPGHAQLLDINCLTTTVLAGIATGVGARLARKAPCESAAGEFRSFDELVRSQSAPEEHVYQC